MQERHSQYLFFGAIAISCAIGCGGNSGPPLGHVTGTVKIKDEPVAGVRVIFIPEGRGSPSYGATDKYGNYQLLFTQHRQGAMLGTHHVQIEPREPTTDDSGKINDTTPMMKVPKKYGQSGVLSVIVASGRNEVNFDLDSED